MGEPWTKRDWPVGTRLFAQTHDPYGYWVFGPATQEQPGDYWMNGYQTAAPSIYTLEQILRHNEAREVDLIDPDMRVDEGL